MRKYSFLFTLLLLSASSFAQNKDFSYKFYGQVRTDLYYNSRANEETVDGLFYMYPKDKIYDTDGKDLNATANGSFSIKIDFITFCTLLQSHIFGTFFSMKYICVML